jgi:hypothetical protein
LQQVHADFETRTNPWPRREDKAQSISLGAVKGRTEMKTALLAAALIAVVTPASAHIWDLKLGVLNEWCNTDTAEAQDQCAAYIMGVWHGIEIADTMAHTTPELIARARAGQVVDDPPKTLVCMPKSEPFDKIISNTTTSIAGVLKQFPNDANEPADALIFNVLEQSYPCKQPKK